MKKRILDMTDSEMYAICRSKRGYIESEWKSDRWTVQHDKHGVTTDYLTACPLCDIDKEKKIGEIKKHPTLNSCSFAALRYYRETKEMLDGWKIEDLYREVEIDEKAFRSVYTE